MKTIKVVGCFLLFPILSWLPAEWWNLGVEPWCLKIFPQWLDKLIYFIVNPLLSKDIGTAAEQMDLLEVWFSTTIIMAIVIMPIFILFTRKLCEDV